MPIKSTHLSYYKICIDIPEELLKFIEQVIISEYFYQGCVSQIRGKNQMNSCVINYLLCNECTISRISNANFPLAVIPNS